MPNFEKLTKEELIELLHKQANKNLKDKASLKELATPSILNEDDTLFLTSAGTIIGKPYIKDSNFLSGYIILTDVMILVSYSPLKTTVFNGSCFQLAIDQIIAITQIDRDSFLSQLQSQQEI